MEEEQRDITDQELAEIARKKREGLEKAKERESLVEIGYDENDGNEVSLGGIESKNQSANAQIGSRSDGSRAKRPYLFDIIPKWLLYSGLPSSLNEKYGMQAWAIFSCLIMLDCRFNPGYPDWFDQGYEEIANLTGLSRWTVSRYIKKFEQAKLIRLIRGKFKGSKSRFKINNFMATPISPHSIRYINGGWQGKKGKRPYLRYYESVAG